MRTSLTRTGLRAVAGLALIAALAACGSGETGAPASNAAGGTIAIDGSSTVFPLSEAAAEAFGQSATGAPRISVGESGTGGGFRKFCRGETQVQGASRPISAEEIAACAEGGVQYVEVPIAFDGISVVVHPSNPLTSITMADLKRFWEPAAQGTVTTWRQVVRAGPDAQLQLFGPGTASGTFDYFTDAVVGEEGSSRTDFTPSEDDNVLVQGVATNNGGMGYFGFAYYQQNTSRLKALALDAGNGPIAPTAETIASGAYPLSRPLFVYFNAEALRQPQVQRFADYFVANAATLATQVGYVGLPGDAYATLATRVSERQVGTAFGGEGDVGLSLQEVLARPLQAAPPAAAPAP
jgi:phosphate transport system substrate-binding protein